MLAAYFEIKESRANVIPLSSACPKSSKPKAKCRPPRTPKKTEVEPFEGGTVHARFVSETPSAKPAAEVEPTDEEEAAFPFEYLWQDGDSGSKFDDDDTDSCLTFDDDASEALETLSASPSTTNDALERAFFQKCKSKASEMPVYSGPELWYEDDEFIE